MRIINLFAMRTFSASLLLLSGQSFAQEQRHSMPMSHQSRQSREMHEDHSQHHQMATRPQTVAEEKPQSLQQEQSSSDETDHAVHIKEHGGQVYQQTTVESKWLRNDDGEGILKSKFETRIGADENKVFIKVQADQAESQQAEYDAKVLYSHMVSDFWDVQAGLGYLNNQNREVDSEQIGVVLGIHGLAPYFFETDVYLYVGQDQQMSFMLETERDLLLTQKLILKPYLDLNVIFSDNSNYAKKLGLSIAQLGLETRYEINKKVMPFVDVAYGYNKGNEETAWQQSSSSENEWLYGAGIRFKF
ncbi:copper resistance protein B [Acinetobacter sp. ANC 4779]|uniref:copper resistance protein B n=1 Tax=Acinetobacter sp. ANC 4779 TaxID=2529848 RepID=UPI00103AE981|nr:copper resistance protein B [Acinetobacter sp. ANC 4779]TCB49626.1 copper resistance protein B [Acinetobacter sp. ANC 4779]